MILLILALLIIHITVEIDAYTDAKLISKGISPKHGKGWRLRLFGFVPAIVLVWLGYHSWIICLAALMFFIFYFWLMFDGRLNGRRHMNFWNPGGDDSDDAHSDNWIQRNSKATHIISKVGGTAFFLIVLIYLILKHENIITSVIKL